MKIHDLSSGIRTQVSNEETLLMKKIYKHNNLLRRAALKDREKEVARQLTQRGVLTRTRKEGKLYYSVDTTKSIWRI